MNIERGLQRIATVLSVGGLAAAAIFLDANDATATAWIVLLAFFALWPWVALYVVRWIVRRFRSH